MLTLLVPGVGMGASETVVTTAPRDIDLKWASRSYDIKWESKDYDLKWESKNYNLKWSSDMAIDTTIEVFAGEDVDLLFTTDNDEDITGWTLQFEVKDSAEMDAKVRFKKTSSDITITSASEGNYTVPVRNANTINLRGKYHWEVCRIDSGSKTVKAKGAFIVRDHTVSLR